MGDEPRADAAAPLDAVVEEVLAEAHVRPEELRPEERAFLERHALKKPLRVLDVWALGVGVVVAGAYFGWNLGLKNNGPVAVLAASLIICLLYLTWVLALAELSVAMPFAGGPLAYGRRAAGPLLGFLMGWSMLLECLFAAIGTALAAGGYIAFLVNPDQPDPTLKVIAGLAVVAVFFGLQAWGVKEQSRAMVVMTYGAVAGLVLFWIVAATHFSWERAWPRGDLLSGKGWRAVLDAVPFALWWLVMIETVALSAEEAHEPHRTIPRGLTWAQLTLIGLVVLTWLFACAAVESQALAVNPPANPGEEATDVDYPLAKAVRLIPAGQSAWLVWGVGGIALFGLIASYHGMIYGASRQAFALGRAGYLPRFLGEVHATRRTPLFALLVGSLLAAGFVVANLWFKDAVAVAVLVSTLTALIWYVLAMVCLYVLRRRDPHLFGHYRAPAARILPAVVIVLSVFAALVYGGIDNGGVVLALTGALYALGLGYYVFWARHRLQSAAPEELGARSAAGRERAPDSPPQGPAWSRWLEWVAAAALLLVLAALGWMALAERLPAWGRLPSLEAEILLVLGLLTAALLLVSVLALRHTRRSRGAAGWSGEKDRT
jgi:ethanolamine permease